MGALFYIIDEGLSLLAALSEPVNTAYMNPGKIYRGSRKDYYDENVLELLSQILRDVPKSLSLDALKNGLKLKWEQPYDFIIPYGDIRHNRFETTWRFDLVRDQLVFDKNEGQSGQLALSVLRQRAFTFDDFESCKSIRAPTYDLSTGFPAPYWEPVFHVSQREVAFTHRIFTDFNFQWRHILRHRYNDLTFKKMAYAILKISIFDFNVKELTEPRQGLGGALIGPLDLPEWDPLEAKITFIGRAWLVASHDPVKGLSLVRKHFQESLSTQQTSSLNTYLIMSIRYLILCRFHENKLQLAQPVTFLNGIDSVSEHAVKILLAATPNQPVKTPIRLLPAELQTRILRYVSHGPVEAARVGCILGLGLPFAWKDGKMDVILETAHRNRHPGIPVQSQVWFGDHFGGIAYKGNTNPTAKPIKP